MQIYIAYAGLLHNYSCFTDSSTNHQILSLSYFLVYNVSRKFKLKNQNDFFPTIISHIVLTYQKLRIHIYIYIRQLITFVFTCLNNRNSKSFTSATILMNPKPELKKTRPQNLSRIRVDRVPRIRLDRVPRIRVDPVPRIRVDRTPRIRVDRILRIRVPSWSRKHLSRNTRAKISRTWMDI